MPRAILIDPNKNPTWIDLDTDVRNHLAKMLPGGHETVEIHRNDWTHFNTGPGIKLGLSENGVVHEPNDFATRVVAKLGGGFRVNGRAIFMGLHDHDIVDLTNEHWGFLVSLAFDMVAEPLKPAEPKTADAQVWFFNGGDEEPSAEAYATLDGAQRAAVTDYEAGDSGPIFADVTYAWRPLDEARHDHWCLDADGTYTGWMVWPVTVRGAK